MHWINEQSSIGIACFVKTPELSPIKTRLATSIGRQNALKLYGLMLHGIRQIFENLLKIDSNCLTYWAVAEQGSESYWSGFPCLQQSSGDLGDRLHSIYSQILKRHDGAILIGADCPLLTVDRLHSASQKLRSQQGFILGPSYDGGFYLFGGTRSIEKKVWNKPTYSSSETKRQLKKELSKIGTVIELEELIDIDEYEDLKMISEINNGRIKNPSLIEIVDFSKEILTKFSKNTSTQFCQ